MDDSGEGRGCSFVFLVGAVVVYLLLGIFLLRFYRYQINPDAISYISIALKYVRGNWGEAVNGYWGPLYSWAMIPFLLAGLPPLLAAKVLSLVVGVFTLVGVWLLSRRLDMSLFFRKTAILLCIPGLVYFALRVIAPDLIMLCILTFYFYLLLEYMGTDSGNARIEGANSLPAGTKIIAGGLFCGVLGGLSYLTKSFGFMFFLVHFTVINLIFILLAESKKIRRRATYHWIAGIVIFLAISGVWIYALSSKYNHLTFGTAGGYNLAINAPGSGGHPMLYQGLISPPNPTAVSAWEDPSYFEVESWHPLQSPEAFKHQLIFTVRNIKMCLLDVKFLSPFLMIVISAGLIRYLPFKRQYRWESTFYLFLTIIIYLGGYCMVYIQNRYLWPVYILSIITGCFYLDKASHRFNLTAVKKYILTACLVVIFCLAPVSFFLYSANLGKRIYHLSKELDGKYSISGRVASDLNWDKTLYISYYNHYRYLGCVKSPRNEEKVIEELEDNEVDYYFVWNHAATGDEYLSEYQEITGGSVEGLRIYRLR